MTRFEECLDFVLECEGGFVDDPVDRGGATNFGITQRTYDRYMHSLGLPMSPVRDISPKHVQAIYKRMYWDAAHCDDFPEPLDLIVFDSAVNHGVGRAIKLLQEVVEAEVDGHYGPDTQAMVEAATQSQDAVELVAQAYLDLRKDFYEVIVAGDPSQNRFMRGWMNRVTKLCKATGVIVT